MLLGYFFAQYWEMTLISEYTTEIAIGKSLKSEFYQSFFWHLLLTLVCFFPLDAAAGTSITASHSCVWFFICWIVKSSFQHQIDHRINANVMTNFCAKFEFFFCFHIQNCLLAYFYRCVYLLTKNKSSRIRKTSHKNCVIFPYFDWINIYLFVCLFVNYLIHFIWEIDQYYPKQFFCERKDSLETIRLVIREKKNRIRKINKWIWVWFCCARNKNVDIFSICMQNSILIEMGRVIYAVYLERITVNSGKIFFHLCVCHYTAMLGYHLTG